MSSTPTLEGQKPLQSKISEQIEAGLCAQARSSMGLLGLKKVTSLALIWTALGAIARR